MLAEPARTESDSRLRPLFTDISDEPKNTIFVIPKNSGLREKCFEIIKNKKINAKIIEVRGEDIPRIVDSDSFIIGITGEDLLKEYTLENYNSKLKVLEKFPWKDKNSLFGKPVLCLLGKKDRAIEELKNKSIRVGINKKYEKIAKKCLNNLEREGYNFNKLYFTGSTEEIFQLGLIDLIIDIVCSGKSASSAGLEVYDKIFESDIVMIRRLE